MIRNKQLFNTILAAGLAVLSFSCDKKDDDSPGTDFDQKAMLTNYADNLIVPAYQELQSKTDALTAAANQFTTNPTVATLTDVRQAWEEAYLAWQNSSVYEIGPAEQQMLRSQLNFFPTDTTSILNNISSGSYTLSNPSNYKAKGFPSLDYLLYSRSSEQAVVDQFATGANAAQRRQYLTDIIADINTTVDAVENDWTGSYRNTFINNAGTDIGSSLGKLVNEFNIDFEQYLKTAKIGIPLGKKTLGIAQPEKVEAYYSGKSAAMAVAQLQNLKQVFNGKTGLGLDDNLAHVAREDDIQDFSIPINQQLDKAIQALQQIPAPLSQAIINNPQVVDQAYMEIQKTVVLVKTDMPSTLGVVITYQDNDGD